MRTTPTSNKAAMKTPLLNAHDVATRWRCHATTAVRIMEKFGYSGLQFGNSRSTRRFEEDQIVRIEAAARNRQKPKGKQPEEPAD